MILQSLSRRSTSLFHFRSHLGRSNPCGYRKNTCTPLTRTNSNNNFNTAINLNPRHRCLSCMSCDILSNKRQIWSFLPSNKSIKGVFNYSVTPFTVNSNIAQDALIFSHKNENFFKFLSLFGVVQMLMWGYFSIFSAQDLRSGPIIKRDTSDLPWWQKVLYTEGRYKNAISILCFTIGASVFFITLTYPRRAVKQLWLLKGGKEVKITSYSWFGKTYTFRTPVEHISCLQSRSGTASQIPLKIKNKYFFFLIDKQGSFHNTDLFDYVIALNRNLK